jgi:hypothetical protein
MPRISQLTSLTTVDSGDELPVVDVSASVTKKTTKADLLKDSGSYLGATNQIPADAIPDDIVTSDMLDLSSTTDANGWKVRDYGNWKYYTKRITYTTSSLAQLSPTNATLSSSNLPVGVTNLSNSIFTFSYFETANTPGFFHLVLNITPSSSTSLVFQATNLRASAQTYGGTIDMTIKV